MSGKKAPRCPYNECYLPDNNTKYIIQFIYLIASVLFLIKDSKEFTFFSVLMFVSPILLDLGYTKFNGKVYTVIRWGYIFINTSIAIFCFAGMFGYFVDNADSFAVNSKAMLLAGASFSKNLFLVPMVLDLMIPVMMHRACPNKKTKEMIEFGREQRRAGCQ